MAYYDITAFAGTTIVSETVKQVAMTDTKEAISRIVLLENGAKFDADGTADADLVLGQVTARYQIARRERNDSTRYRRGNAGRAAGQARHVDRQTVRA